MTRGQRKAVKDFLVTAFEEAIAILEGGMRSVSGALDRRAFGLLKHACERLRSDARALGKNGTHRLSDELRCLGFEPAVAETLMSLVDARDIMAYAAGILYEYGATEEAERADVASEYLREYAEAAYEEASAEDYVGHHEGTNVEEDFARLYAEFTTSRHLDPNDLPAALRAALLDAGFGIEAVDSIADEELLADARMCRARKVARGQAGT